MHSGRLVKLMGDGALVEFGSVVAAVNCALAIQHATDQSELERAEAKRIRYRIGINSGDVIVDGDDIYGEGVNVTARLQALAPAGGIAVSLSVRDQVKGKATCSFEDLGDHAVKNIQAPIRVFAGHYADAAAHKPGESQMPRRLAICVLPFANMSGDPEQDPESYDAHAAAARWNYLTRQFEDAIHHYEKAASLVETEHASAGLLASCYKAIGDQEGARRAAQRSPTSKRSSRSSPTTDRR